MYTAPACPAFSWRHLNVISVHDTSCGFQQPLRSHAAELGSSPKVTAGPRWNHNRTNEREPAELSTVSAPCVVSEGSQPSEGPQTPAPQAGSQGDHGHTPTHPSACDGGAVARVTPVLILLSL